MCWCKHNNDGNNTTRNWIILLNIINVKKEITQHYLDWGATLALFKEIQALGWLNFVTGVNLLWLVSLKIQQSKKCLDTSILHLPLAHVSSPISETIHVSSLITTIKKNKIVSLFFNVGLNNFTNSLSSIFIPISLHLCYNIYSF